MTIEQFQNLYVISMMEMDDIDRSIMLVKALTGKSEQEIERMPIKKFNKICKDIDKSFKLMTEKLELDKPVNIVKANGRRYFLNYDLSKKPMNAGKYVELATFSEDVVGNLHKIMATMATPLKWSWKGLVKTEREHSEIAEDMLKMEFSTAYHSMVFFWAVFKESIKSLTISMIQEEKKEELKEWLQVFTETSDGLITAKWFQNLKISV